MRSMLREDQAHKTRSWSQGDRSPTCWSSRKAKDSDRKSTRLNSSHLVISYAVFCLEKRHVRFAWFYLSAIVRGRSVAASDLEYGSLLLWLGFCSSFRFFFNRAQAATHSPFPHHHSPPH